MHFRFGKMKIRQIPTRIFAFLLISIVALQAMASTNDVAISLYNRWENLPSDKLVQMGYHYRNVARQPDSAMVCFSIVANRYYTHKLDREDIEHSIEAMLNMASLYCEYFYDYAKAETYNLEAKELAEKHQCNKHLSNIIMHEAYLEELMNLEPDFHPKTVALYKQAFKAAYQQKDWGDMYDSFLNLMFMTTFHDKESMIEQEMEIIKTAPIPPDTLFCYNFARCLIDVVRTWDKKQYDSTEVYLSRLKEIAHSQKITPAHRATCQIAANTYCAFFYMGVYKQPDKELAALKDNERIATQFNLLPYLIATYQNLKEYYQAKNDTTMYEHYRMLAMEKTVEMLSNKKLGNVKETKFIYELNKKNEEVRALAAREQMKNRMMWGALAFAVVLLVVLALLWLNYRRVQERNRSLYENSLEMLRADEEKRQLIEQLQQSQHVEPEPVSPYAPAEEPQRESILDEARQSDLLHRIFIVMETSDEIFSPDFSLPRLAELVGDHRNYVSDAINRRYRDNFNGLVNEYRIKEACRRINDRARWGDYTLEAIGKSVGFRSRSGFSTIFKQFTGLTPSAYQRQSKGDATSHTD